VWVPVDWLTVNAVGYEETGSRCDRTQIDVADTWNGLGGRVCSRSHGIAFRAHASIDYSSGPTPWTRESGRNPNFMGLETPQGPPQSTGNCRSSRHLPRGAARWDGGVDVGAMVLSPRDGPLASRLAVAFRAHAPTPN